MQNGIRRFSLPQPPADDTVWQFFQAACDITAVTSTIYHQGGDHSKRFLCLLLTLILAASLCAFPAAAADQTCPSSKDDPVVFVHGLMGWGQRAGINAVLPYWGMTTGSLTSYFNSLGYETY